MTTMPLLENWSPCPVTTLSSDDLDKPRLSLVDVIWKDRPTLLLSPFRVHALEHAGVSWQEKVARVRHAMAQGGNSKTQKSSSTPHPCTLAVFGTLDDVPYLLNIHATGDIDTYVRVKEKDRKRERERKRIGLRLREIHLTKMSTVSF